MISTVRIFVITVLTALIAAPHLTHAVPASGTVIVRCGVSTTYGPSIAAGTQLILRDCYGANATNGTTVVVTITAATAAASSGLSIVVADSRRVAVQVVATANVSISHLSVTVRNVTNDASERTATSVACSPSSCRPLVRINQVLHLVNASVSVADVTHVRNKSAVYIEDITGSVSDLALTVTNVSATSSVPVAGIDTVNGTLVTSSVVVVGVVHTVTSIANPTVATVLLDGIASIALTNITIVDCALRGVTTSAGSGAMVGVQNSALSDTSWIVVSNAQLQMTAALSMCAAFIIGTTVGISSVSIVNATAVRSPIAVLLLLLQNATTSRGAAFAVRSGNVDVISSSSAVPSIGIDILSSAVADSHFIVSNLTMTSITPAAELFRSTYLTSVPRAGQLLRSNVSISNCSVSAVVGVVLFLYNVSVSAVQVSISDVAVTSQYPAILLYLLPVATSVSIVVLSSTLVAPNTIYFESSDISDLTTVVLFSTLKTSTTSLFASPAYVLFISSSTLRRSSVSFVATATGGVASGALAGHVVGVTSSELLDGTRINATLTTIASSGGVLQLYGSVVANSSTIEVSVAGNITVPPSFPRSVVYVYSTTIANSSTVRVVLPLDVGMASGSSQFAALYVDGASVSNASLLELVGVATVATRIVWPNSALWLLSSIAANSSRIVLQGFHFVTTTNVTVDVARVRSCSVQLVSQLTIANVALCGGTFPLAMSFVNASTTSAIIIANVSCRRANGTAARCVQLAESRFLDLSRATVDNVLVDVVDNFTFADPSVLVTIRNSTFNESSTVVVAAVSAAAVPSSMSSLTVLEVTNAVFMGTTTDAFVSVALPSAVSCLMMIAIMNTTVFGAQWSGSPPAPGVARNSLVHVHAATAEQPMGAAWPNVSLVADHLTMFGAVSLISTAGDVGNGPSLLALQVTQLLLACCWWARHPFTGSRSPLLTALKGSVIASGTPQPAVGWWTNVTATACLSVAEEGVDAVMSWSVSEHVASTAATLSPPQSHSHDATTTQRSDRSVSTPPSTSHVTSRSLSKFSRHQASPSISKTQSSSSPLLSSLSTVSSTKSSRGTSDVHATISLVGTTASLSASPLTASSSDSVDLTPQQSTSTSQAVAPNSPSHSRTSSVSQSQSSNHEAYFVVGSTSATASSGLTRVSAASVDKTSTQALVISRSATMPHALHPHSRSSSKINVTGSNHDVALSSSKLLTSRGAITCPSLTQTQTRSVSPSDASPMDEPIAVLGVKAITQLIAPTVSAATSALGGGAGSISGSVLIRSALMQQLSRCATVDNNMNDNDANGSSSSGSTRRGGAVAVLIGGDDGNIFQIHFGSSMDVGYGYRGVLLGSGVLVVGSAFLVTAVAPLKWLWDVQGRSTARMPSLRRVAAGTALPGWWLAGPCSMAIGPLLSSSVSLANVSDWSTSSDVAMILVALLMCLALTFLWVKALLRPSRGGWFVAVSIGAAPPPHIPSTTPMRRQLQWLLGGGYLWAVDDRVTPQPHLLHQTPSSAAEWRVCFVAAYGSLFASLWPHRHWWFLVDLAFSGVVGLLTALPALYAHHETDENVQVVCTGALHAATAMQVLYVFVMIFTWPIAVRWECGAAVISSIIGATVAVLQSFSTSNAADGDVLDSVNAALSIAQVVATIVVTLTGAAGDVFLLVTNQGAWTLRRDIAQGTSSKGCDTHRAARVKMRRSTLTSVFRERPIRVGEDVLPLSGARGLAPSELPEATYESLISLILQITERRRSQQYYES